ncbi:MAG: DMT family transporter [Rhizobiaceae bacterium]|nr:DMT family transporter [Rhizobiaceae bacterium]
MSRLSNPSVADYGMLILLAAIFGGSFVLTSVSVHEVPAIFVVAARLVLATLILYAAMLIAKQSLPKFGPIWWVIAAAALLGSALPFFLISWAQESVDAGLAAILMAVMPLVTLVLAHIFTKDEKLTPTKVIGFLFGVVGVAVLIGFDKLGTLGDEAMRQYALIAAAICYAANAVITKYLVGLPRRATATALVGVATLMILPVCLIFGEFPSSSISNLALASIVGLAIFPTAIGTLLIFEIVDRQGASFLSQINFLVPVAGVIWGILLLSERLPANAWIALLIILTGVVIARLKLQPSKLSARKGRIKDKS